LYHVQRQTSVWRSFIERAMADPGASQAIVEMYQTVGGALPRGTDLPNDVASRSLIARKLEEAFRRGELAVISRWSGGGGGAEGSRKLAMAAGQGLNGSTAMGQTPRERTWIEIHLVDQDGNPLPGRRYRLQITDGSVREGVVGADGAIRVSGIDPGQCSISFPDLDGREWQRG
jgi:hypothetical protein